MARLVDDRQAAMESAVRLGFLSSVPDGWDVKAIADAQGAMGLVLVKGPEAHIGIERPAFIRPVLRQVLGQQIAAYGHAVTTVRSLHVQGQAFVERLGFKRIHEADGLIHYEMKELRHA